VKASGERDSCSATVLRDVTFTCEAGQRVAIVGPSGAGKSTLIALLLRLYDPKSGSIRFDGQPAHDYPLDFLRSQMGTVPQEVLLFGGTICENIGYGRIGAVDEEIQAAACQANAHDFIEAFPDGYDTAVGDRGVKLLEGQRQRIAIARAILADPAVLILDEATSSLDSENEQRGAGSARPVDGGAHFHHHCPSPRHGPESRPDRGARRRKGGRVRHS